MDEPLSVSLDTTRHVSPRRYVFAPARHIRRTRAFLLPVLVFCFACARVVDRKLHTPDAVGQLDPDSRFLKIHMRDGRLYVLSDWFISPNAHAATVKGNGVLYGTDRDTLGIGSFAVRTDSVSLFETNVVHVSPAIAPLAVVSIGSIILSIICLTQEKACFGSCPTFYVSNGQHSVLMAEGFSASVAPALEERDIDALFHAVPDGDTLEITMKNEALETHVVRYAHVLAAPRRPSVRVFATASGEFWNADSLTPPDRAVAPEGDCSAALLALDGVERSSVTDSTDLAAREIVDLEFEAPPAGPLGLVLGARQTLLTTYLFYQGLAYFGTRAVEFLASLDRAGPVVNMPVAAMDSLVGWITVQVATESGWRTVAVDRETGPIATDVRLVKLPEIPAGTLRLRLLLTRGAWRLDQAALVHLLDRAEPVRLCPTHVRRDGTADAGVEHGLCDEEHVLTTLPGDSYTLVYRLPRDDIAYELFLESKGYYLEWMREAWMKEENSEKAAMLLLNPRQLLLELAPEYKRIEPEMEKVFWASRYGRP